jgi:hypothetical protein
VFEYANVLPDKWKNRAAKLNVGDVAKAVQETPVWAGPDEVLKELEDLRSLRNLVAHFSFRRFPNDGAFLFITKSARDYKRVSGSEPELGVSMTAIVECEQVKGALRRIEYIHNWLALVVPEFEKRIGPTLDHDGRHRA